MVKNLPANADGDIRHMSLIPGLGRFPRVGNGNPLQYLAWKIPWTEELAGYSPYGRKESDMTKHAHTHATVCQAPRGKTNMVPAFTKMAF